MRMLCVEIQNFRRLKATHIDFDKETTIFVGANNSGKTSAMVALRYFLLSPSSLKLRDITLSLWPLIDSIGDSWLLGVDAPADLNDLLPSMDIWLHADANEIHHVVHVLPTLDWKGGRIGVRLKYLISDIQRLRNDFLFHREAAIKVGTQKTGDKEESIRVWPSNLTDYLESRLRSYIEISAFSLNPELFVQPENGVAKPQLLPDDSIAIDKDPFKSLIRIDDIAAQRDFADAGGRSMPQSEEEHKSNRFKRRLSHQLRTYFDKHLDPRKSPAEGDFLALRAIQEAEKSFDERLKQSFEPAFKELQDLGYPGITNPKLEIATQVQPSEALDHSSALQYKIADVAGHSPKALKLPEDYSGLGYQNLIAMVFMLMSFRDGWMRVGKAANLGEGDKHELPLLHIVLVEEPEAHLHAQVQQVFIKKAYELLRKHESLRNKETYQTQLIVSTHSSHIAHETDFSFLRYFRRRPASEDSIIPTTTVTNLSHVFGKDEETPKFVKRYLKATHCDLFFADGIIFVEGQAERILLPQFIRNHFPELSRCYITLLELCGSHAHRFKSLIDALGVTTLIIADLDSTKLTDVKSQSSAAGQVKRPLSVKPELGQGQETANSVLKSWHPKKRLVDELASLKSEEHSYRTDDGLEVAPVLRASFVRS
ncbi:MAG: ATP-dependent endonuclease [Candidatus Melainabacteria bacterium]|nr:MAG: ATP-dependent endonuclease [Candidatus Melainabacteria bacterium]